MICKSRSLTVLIVVFLVAVLLPVPIGRGDATYAASGIVFGSIAAPGDWDVSPLLTRAEGGASVCYRDLDGLGEYSVGDAVYLALGVPDCFVEPGMVATDWVRLSATQGHEPGTLVRQAHLDHGEVVGRIFDVASFDEGLLWFYDMQGTDSYSQGDTAYLSEDSWVRPGDLRLSMGGPGEAGSQVQSGDADLNLELTPWVSSRVADASYYLEADHRVGFSRGDIPFLLGANRVPGADTMATVNELRLGSMGEEHGFGSQLRPTDSDAVGFLRDDFAGVGGAHDISVCALSRDGSGEYMPGNSVYLVPGSTDCRGEGNVRIGDFRLTGEDAGRTVRAGDGDRQLGPYLQLDGEGPAGPRFLAYWDARPPFGVFNEGDVLYLVTDDGRSQVRTGDIRLTPFEGFPAGSIVDLPNPDNNIRLEPFLVDDEIDHMDLFAYFDRNSDGVFDQGDLLYLRRDPGQDLVVHNLVRLGELGGGLGFGSVTRAGDGDVATGLHRHEASGGQPVFCGIDLRGEGILAPDDPVVIRREGSCSGSSGAFDLRVSTTEHGVAGSFVRAGDMDWNRALVALENELCLDVTAGPERTLDHPFVALYLTGCAAVVHVGDLRLTQMQDYPAGSRVAAGDADHGTELRYTEGEEEESVWDPAGLVYYHDWSGAGRLGQGDLVYLALHASDQNPPGPEGFVQVNYVRLVQKEPEPPENVPDLPRELVAVAGDRQVALSWRPPGNAPVDEYRVMWGEELGEHPEVLSVEEPEVVVTGLLNNVTYYFVVAAVNAAGQGPYSEEVAAVPHVEGMPPIGTPPIPSAPHALQGSLVGEGRLELEWQPPERGVPILEYRVAWGQTLGGFFPQERLVEETSLIVEDLNPGGSYVFVVSARNAAGEGPVSQEFIMDFGAEEEGIPGVGIGFLLLGMSGILWLMRSGERGRR